MTSLPTILLILAAISSGATVIAILVALRSAREARSAIFPIVREEEAVRARRARVSIFGWLALTALFLGGWLATLRLVDTTDAQQLAESETVEADEADVISFTTEAQPISVSPSPTPITIIVGDMQSPTTPPDSSILSMTPLPTTVTSEPPAPAAVATQPEAAAPSPTAAPPEVPTSSPIPVPPTNTPTATPVPPTATPTETSTPAPPTATPTSLADAARIPTSAPRTPAPPDAKMGPIQFAEGVTSDLEPVNPDDTFVDGIEAIYAVYPFSGMERGLDFAVVWYKDGAELGREEEEWRFGDRARSYNYLVPRGKGLYKLELYVNDSVMATGLFEVR